MKTQALLAAIRLFGTQKMLGKAIGATRQQINNWLNRDDEIPYHYVIMIYAVTGGKVAIDQLAPKQKMANTLIKSWYQQHSKDSVFIDIKTIKINKNRDSLIQKLIYVENRHTNTARPIIVDNNNQLVIGEHRLLTNRTEGKHKILAYILNYNDFLQKTDVIEELAETLPLSERTAIGVSIEKYFREKKLSYRNNKEQNLEQNLPKFWQIKNTIIKRLGFNNIISYQQIKKIIRNNPSELVLSLDKNLISLEQALIVHKKNNSRI